MVPRSLKGNLRQGRDDGAKDSNHHKAVGIRFLQRFCRNESGSGTGNTEKHALML